MVSGGEPPMFGTRIVDARDEPLTDFVVSLRP